MKVAEYGRTGPRVVLLHGGPGAPGYLRPVAEQLSRDFRVLEPWQRPSGGEPLSVARHVEDLDRLVSRFAPSRPALAGHSWGAMLALAYAAAHPDKVAALLLIACGTFDPASRRRLQDTLEKRTGSRLRRRLSALRARSLDPDREMAEMARLTLPLYCHGPLAADLPIGQCDARAHRESWRDMLRLQDEGVYPDAFAAITAPILMLHGAGDPHPGRMIRDNLAPYLPQLEYHEWDRCGHYPWLEAAVRDDFFARSAGWLTRRLGRPEEEAS